MARIAVLGAGVMGTALTFPPADNGHDVRLIGTHLDDAIIARCRSDGTHPRLGRALPPGVRPYAFSEAAAAIDGADVVALGVNSRGVRWAGQVLAQYLRPGQRVLMVTKGLAASANGDLRIFPDLLTEEWPDSLRAGVPVAAIGGPSIAGELAARRQTAVVFTCRDAATLSYLAPLFATNYYHIWTSTDIVGVEVCVAMKNVYALGVGFVPGLLEAAGGPDGNAAMHNHAAAFFAQGLAETAQLIQLMGGGIETVFSLPGAGDLYVTTQGGRNSRMGRLLGMGVDPEEAAEQMVGESVEGLDAAMTIAPAVERLIGRSVLPPNAMPLLRQIYAVAVKGQPVEPISEQFFQRRAKGEGILTERDQRAFEVVMTQTQRLNHMIEALLDVSRLETGQLSLVRAPLDIRVLARQVMNEIQPTLRQHTIAYTAPERPLMVEGDSLRLEQVLQNLIQNAVKYSPNGGAIHIQVRQEGATACVDVTDNGIGIPKEAQERLFTRFYRAGNVEAEQISGLGIGLYVVKEIVTLHGGTITVESVEGVGSTFTVCLPLSEHTDAQDEQGAS